MDQTRLRGAYARLKGLKAAIGSQPDSYYSPDAYGRDYNSVVAEISEVIDENLDHFKLPHNAYKQNSEEYSLRVDELDGKLQQILSYIEYVYHVNEGIIEIGSIYNSISDEELKSRCSDLLSAPGHFDRVINQATQVLEDRLRAKGSSIDGVDISGKSGVPLVNQLLRNQPAESPIIFSQEQNEHEGFCHIFRGIMGAFRNPTHHRLIENITREQALQVCAFIDNLLRLLDKANVDNK